jgi:hypothetical protein
LIRVRHGKRRATLSVVSQIFAESKTAPAGVSNGHIVLR